MTDYVPPLDDLRFVLDEIAELPKILEFEEFNQYSSDDVHGALEEAGRLAASVLAPLNRLGDTEPAVLQKDGRVTHPDGFVKAYKTYSDAGWGGVSFPEEYGGGGMPGLVGVAMQELVCAANISFAMCPGLTSGAIEAILHHGSEELKETYLPKLVAGEWTGTMNLTESQAGSDVGALTTKAIKQDDGTYRIRGNKIFISFGEHEWAENIIHLVLARTPDAPPGTKGISLFIVPKVLVKDDGSLGEHNNVVCTGIEHKLGIKASPTCSLSFDDSVGYLVGDENRGMKYMFTMMNRARLGVGLQGLAVGERSQQDAVAYANERRQGRALDETEDGQSLIIRHPDVKRMLLANRVQLDAVRALLLYNAAMLDRRVYGPEEERARAGEWEDMLIPMTKAWGTDVGMDVTSTTVQVLGGMGYIEESGAPQYMRDARIFPIYEGTNGIQAMDLLFRKLTMRGGGAIMDTIAEFKQTVADLDSLGDEAKSLRDRLDQGIKDLEQAVQWLMEHALANPRDGLAGATPFLRLMSLVTGGWLLAKGVLAAKRLIDDGKDDYSEGYLAAKLPLANFYADHFLSGTTSLLGPVCAGVEELDEVQDAVLG